MLNTKPNIKLPKEQAGMFNSHVFKKYAAALDLKITKVEYFKLSRIYYVTFDHPYIRYIKVVGDSANIYCGDSTKLGFYFKSTKQLAEHLANLLVKVTGASQLLDIPAAITSEALIIGEDIYNKVRSLNNSDIRKGKYNDLNCIVFRNDETSCNLSVYHRNGEVSHIERGYSIS